MYYKLLIAITIIFTGLNLKTGLSQNNPVR